MASLNEESSRTFLRVVAEATPEELQEAAAAGVLGPICGRFFDESGHQVDLALTERVLSVDLPDLPDFRRSRSSPPVGRRHGPEPVPFAVTWPTSSSSTARGVTRAEIVSALVRELTDSLPTLTQAADGTTTD